MAKKTKNKSAEKRVTGSASILALAVKKAKARAAESKKRMHSAKTLLKAARKAFKEARKLAKRARAAADNAKKAYKRALTDSRTDGKAVAVASVAAAKRARRKPSANKSAPARRESTIANKSAGGQKSARRLPVPRKKAARGDAAIIGQSVIDAADTAEQDARANDPATPV